MQVVRRKLVRAGENHRYQHRRVALPGTKAGQLDPEVIEEEGESPNGSDGDGFSIDTDSLQNPGNREFSDEAELDDSRSVSKRVKYSGRVTNAFIPEKNRKCFSLAMVFLRAKIAAENPWPSADQGKRMIYESWKEAREFRIQNLAKNGFSMENLEGDEVPDSQSKAKVCITSR